MAKPYAPSHIASVASSFTEMRLSGAVKESLVTMLCDEIKRLVPKMEAATLAATPDKKTLDDTNRTHLNYNRTRELMIEEIGDLDSVGSQAVQAAVIHLEDYLKRTLHSAEMAAAKDRVSTIKLRHLSIAAPASDETEDIVQEEEEPDVLEGQVGGSALTPMALRKMARSLSVRGRASAGWFWLCLRNTGRTLRHSVIPKMWKPLSLGVLKRLGNCG